MGLALFLVCVALAFGRSSTHVLTAGQPVHLDGFAPDLSGRRALLGPGVAVALGFAGVLGGRSFPLLLPAGMACILLALGLLARREERDWGEGLVADLGQYAPTAAAIAGWLLTWLTAWSLGPDAREAAAWSGACGVLGAAYFLAGASKIAAGGLGWARPSGLGLVLLERSHRGSPWQRRLRRALAHQPVLTGAGAAGALLVELAAPVFWVPELRLGYAVAAAAMQFSFWFVLGFFELEWFLLLPALALLSVG